MSRFLVNAVGGVAAVCSMTSFAPQLIKIFKERDASAVSARMFVITAVGFALWSVYGLMSKAWPLVASNLVCLAMSLAILVAKWRFSNPPFG